MVYARFKGNDYLGSQSDNYWISVALGGAFFEIIQITYPASLAPGTEFFLSPQAHNAGEDIGELKIGGLRHWNQTTFVWPMTFTIIPCQSVGLGMGGEIMPSVDATYTFWTQHRSHDTGDWINDDEKTITVKVILPEPEHTLTIISTLGGTTEPSPGSYSYPEGGTVRATAYPELGYRFDYWELDGAVRTENPIDVLMDMGHILKAVFAEEPVPTHILTIGTVGQGTTDPAPGQWEYPDGVEVVVTAIPNAGQQFSHWEGDIGGVINPLIFFMPNYDVSITAIFEEIPPIMHTVTIEVSGSGVTIPAMGDHIYAEGTVVNITAIPDTGWEFTRWEGDASGTDSPITITVTQDMTVRAVFTEVIVPPVEHSVAVSIVGQGTTDPAAGSYPILDGNYLTVTAYPAAGWQFDHWGGSILTTENPVTVQVLADMSIVAVFTEIVIPTHTVTITVEGNGTTEPPPGAREYEEGSQASITAIPTAGWEFKRWEGDLPSTANPLNFTVTVDISVTAVFEEVIVPPEKHAVSISIVGQGSTAPAPGTYQVEEGTTMTITALPDEGWKFDHWGGDISSTDNPVQVIVNADISVVAVFVEEPVIPPEPSWLNALVAGLVIVAVIPAVSEGS